MCRPAIGAIFSQTMTNPIGIILAGGASRRMGRDKAGVELAGRPMADWVADALLSVLDDVIVVGRETPLAGLDSVPDAWPGKLGPLAGLATALHRFRRPVVLVAVDQPLLRPETIERLAHVGDSSDAVLPIDQHTPQVTCARYPARWADPAAAMVEAGGSIRQLLATEPHLEVDPAAWARWGEDGRSWFSIDSDERILEAERRFRLDLA